MAKLRPIEILERMPGKTFIYEGKHLQVIKHEFVDERCIVHTTEGPINFPWVDAGSALKRFQAVAEDDLQDQKNAMALYNGSRNMVAELQQIMMDNISKIKADPAYVQQGKVINNSVNTMLHMVNLQLKVLKAQREE